MVLKLYKFIIRSAEIWYPPA